jgi:cobalt/nickel transport system permease protein
MCIAAYARLFRKKTNISTLKIVGNIVGMLFAHGFERTQRVYYAMSSRGYRGEIKTQDEFKLSLSDFLKAFLIILLAIALQLVR